MVIQPSSLDTNLDQLLREVNDGTMQLPEFQRDWTWDDNRIQGIIASLSQGYPMGAIMRLQYGNPDIRFKYRTISGVENVIASPDYLVLDGQQRLTSIYQSLFSSNVVKTKTEKNKEIKRYYYLSMKDCLDDNVDRLDAVIAVPEDRIIKENFNRDVVLDLSSRELEYAQKMFPVNVIFHNDSLMEWSMGYWQYYSMDQEALDLFKEFNDSVIKTISAYKLPVITLDKSTPREAVCKVFENVNTGGVSLTVFELVTATFATYEFDLRKDWEECKKAITGEGESLKTDLFDGIDETAFLTTVTLLTSYLKKTEGKAGAVSCKKKDVLALDFEDYKINRDRVLEGFRLARIFLTTYQYVFRMRDLPYATQIIPLAAICAVLGESKCFEPNAIKILSRWYWCGILGEMYGGANETRYANDIEDVVDAINGKPGEIRTVNAAFFSSTRLLTLQTRLSAAYKGIMALLYKERCQDFMNATTIDLIHSLEQSPDIHHIFPEAYCKNTGIPRTKYNSIVNKTPILPKTNRSIGGNAPSKYTASILKAVDGLTEEELKERIESHLIDYEYLKADDFDNYFVERAKSLLNLIEKAMGKPVSDRGAEDTIEKFGASLEGGKKPAKVLIKIKQPVKLPSDLREWARNNKEIILVEDKCDDTYTRFLTDKMSSILPPVKGYLSGWKTDNCYFYELIEKRDKVYIQLALSGMNAPDVIREKYTLIDEFYPSIEDYPSKGQWEWRHVFRTTPIKVDENSSRDWLNTQLDIAFNEIKSFEADLQAKLNDVGN